MLKSSIVMRGVILGALLIVSAQAAGCRKAGYQTSEVEGVVVVQGKPADKISIRFNPEGGGEGGTAGPSSVAITDAQGHFTLMLAEGDAKDHRPGAVVGQHRVTLSDLRYAESATGIDVPMRIPADYTLVGSTPLRQEVKPGERQTIEIKLP